MGRAYQGIANIIHDPRLLDCQQYPFDDNEQINAFSRFLLQLEQEKEGGKGDSRNRERVLFLSAEINKTTTGTYSIHDLQKVLDIDPNCQAHYHAMAFYKAVRWFGYANNVYVPRYEDVLKESSSNTVAKQRLALYNRDAVVYKQTALQSLYSLMDIVYAQLPGIDNEKNIVLNNSRDEDHRIPYSVSRETDGSFTFFSGKRHRHISDEQSFRTSTQNLGRRATTDPEKTFSQLLRLGYLDFLTRSL